MRGSDLELPCPLSYVIVVLTHMSCVEVGERHWLSRTDPDLSQHARVYIAHQDLPDSVEAVCFTSLSFRVV